MNGINILQNIFKNRSISIIGPAPTLIGKNLGEKIDSFDIVLRPNMTFNIPENRKIDYGSKFDILSTCFNRWCLDAIKNELNFTNIKLIFNCQIMYENIETIEAELKLYFSKFLYIPTSFFSVIYDKVKTASNSGLNCIEMANQFGAKEIFIAGFNFYNNENFSNWNDIYFEEYKINEFKYDKTMYQIPTSGHNLKNQKDYLIDLIKNNKHITWFENE